MQMFPLTGKNEINTPPFSYYNYNNVHNSSNFINIYSVIS